MPFLHPHPLPFPILVLSLLPFLFFPHAPMHKLPGDLHGLLGAARDAGGPAGRAAQLQHSRHLEPHQSVFVPRRATRLQHLLF